MTAIKIRAQILDIRTLDPRADYRFVVDTNAWYWMTYNRASYVDNKPKANQLQQYLHFIKKSLEVGCTILRCEMALAELSHIIERTEREILSKYLGSEVKSKDYRHNIIERKKVVKAIKSAWSQVQSMSESTATTVDKTFADAALLALESCELDGYDSFYTQTMSAMKTKCILTDDMDFATVEGLVVLTSNNALIRSATDAGKLGNESTLTF
jgi:hypothetical protein